MKITRRLMVANTDIEVYLDRNLHIMDKEMPGTSKVLTMMNSEYLNKIMSGLGNYPYSRVLLYHSNGAVSEWTNNQFQMVDYLDSDLIIGFWSA